jgi:hypothetical protein
MQKLKENLVSRLLMVGDATWLKGILIWEWFEHKGVFLWWLSRWCCYNWMWHKTLDRGKIVVIIIFNGKCGPSVHELLDMGYEFTLDDNLQEDLPQCNPCKDLNDWGKIGSHYNNGEFCKYPKFCIS